MSESELDEILNEVRKKANSNMPVDPPTISDNGRIRRADASPKIPQRPVTDFDVVYNSIGGDKGIGDDSFGLHPAVNSRRRGDDNSPSRKKNDKKPPKKNKKLPLIIALVAVIVIGAAVGIYFGFFADKKAEEPQEPQQNVAVKEEDAVLNPLTGESGFNTAAVGKRPVAVVVENEYSTEAVRPQWALSDADIVLEGESEFSTRLLLFWADYTDVPEMVGPTRSARPPFIRFSGLFDSIFIHAGLSQSKGDYIGADTVFETENTDHINLLHLTEDGTYFGRNNERNTAVEHTGYLNGKNLPQLIADKGFDTELDTNSFTAFSFNKEAQVLSDISANTCKFRWSNASCPKVAKFSYDTASGKYTTTDFDSDFGESGVQFENLIFLFDETEYIVKENYKGYGNSETYCDYKLTGGNGTILSKGTALEIKWGVADGKLWMKTLDDKEVKLNPGKIYIGYGSSNKGGSLELNPVEQ